MAQVYISIYTSIEESAFSYCWSLEDVYIPASVTTIGDDAFDFEYCEEMVVHVPIGCFAEKLYCEQDRADNDVSGVWKTSNANTTGYGIKYLRAARKEYDRLVSEINEQELIVQNNRGWFGKSAKTRKEAQRKIEELRSVLNQKFPDGRP